MDGQAQQKLTFAAAAQAGLQPEDIWIQYFAMGGSLAQIEIEAYLRGLLDLPAAERDTLAGAVNEILEDTSSSLRVPYSAGRDQQDSPAQARRALGAAGAFLLSAGEAEEERLDALRRTGLLDTRPEERFDSITRRAKEQFGVSSSTIALIDDHRQFLKSVVGPVGKDMPREISFCNVTIRNAGPLIVNDASTDERFRENPLVLGEPYIRFYAGYPLRGPSGWTIGTLCLIDQQARAFSPEDEQVLRILAEMAQRELNHP
ncbi:GAF domain-containing protein [Arthrobacter sp. Br18]|uniref:GAF domain-containing protein n=1 Tax=Arthrobacter sp. Br18 TaxID=1312954 RepID=UPI0004B30A2D|nr:GAF domain-containing protein [Arthrobacter sp. Br18]